MNSDGCQRCPSQLTDPQAAGYQELIAMGQEDELPASMWATPRLQQTPILAPSPACSLIYNVQESILLRSYSTKSQLRTVSNC